MIKNEIRPVDIYCYFGARFGQPNGIQNFLRADDSANLIHWEWVLKFEDSLLSIQGMNFRTEIWIHGPEYSEDDKVEFVRQLKMHMSQNGESMRKVRATLENWTEFVNPYKRLRLAISNLMDELKALELEPRAPELTEILANVEPAQFEAIWKEHAYKHSKAFGICFGTRSMLPVMAESFVNLLIFVLLKPDLRKDNRLRENILREPIDIRVKSLHHNCVGFGRAVDYSSSACANFHRLVNERNDLLHGNFVIKKLKFNELHFFRKVPVFKEYSSLWERSIGVSARSVGLDIVKKEFEVVEKFVEYLSSCLDTSIRQEIASIADQLHLGICSDDNRLGVLFPDALMDWVAVPGSPK